MKNRELGGGRDGGELSQRVWPGLPCFPCFVLQAGDVCTEKRPVAVGNGVTTSSGGGPQPQGPLARADPPLPLQSGSKLHRVSRKERGAGLAHCPADQSAALPTEYNVPSTTGVTSAEEKALPHWAQ